MEVAEEATDSGARLNAVAPCCVEVVEMLRVAIRADTPDNRQKTKERG
jgi:hypothetical protein